MRVLCRTSAYSASGSRSTAIPADKCLTHTAEESDDVVRAGLQMPDVLIVGAGPVGLTLANDLARRNVDFRIIDELETPTIRSRAHGMQARTLEALDVLNLAEPMIAAGQHPQPPLLMMHGAKLLARVDFGNMQHSPYRYPYQFVIWQQRVEQVLNDALLKAGHFIERSTKLLDIAMDDNGVTAKVERDGTQEHVRASWIVSCEGGRSVVREKLGLKMRGAGKLRGTFLIGEVDMDWKRSRDQMYEWWHDAGIATALYIDFTQRWHVLVEHSGEQITQDAQLDLMNAFFRERTQENVNITNPAWIVDTVFYNGMPDRFIVGRAILAGDAAHVHIAAGGQGMNTGIQDALNLGWKLALTVSGAANAALLQTYESERWPNARAVLRATQLYRKIQLPRGWFGRTLAAALFNAMRIGPLGDALLGRRVGMLGIHYRKSTLSRQQSKRYRRDTSAGYRVPDLPCRTATTALRLFDVIRGTRATLLLFAGQAPDASVLNALHMIASEMSALSDLVRVRYIFASEIDAQAAEMHDSDALLDGTEHLQRGLGLLVPEVLYIRPDGYIGLRTDDLNPRTLSDYLSRIYALPRRGTPKKGPS